MVLLILNDGQRWCMSVCWRVSRYSDPQQGYRRTENLSGDLGRSVTKGSSVSQEKVPNSTQMVSETPDTRGKGKAEDEHQWGSTENGQIRLKRNAREDGRDVRQ